MDITPNVQADIAAAVRSVGGREICGYLLAAGTLHQEFYVLPNLAKTSHAFLVSDQAIKRAYCYAADRHLKVLAFVHSHPRNVALSAADQISFAWTRIPWIVVALEGDRLHMATYYPPGKE